MPGANPPTWTTAVDPEEEAIQLEPKTLLVIGNGLSVGARIYDFVLVDIGSVTRELSGG